MSNDTYSVREEIIDENGASKTDYVPMQEVHYTAISHKTTAQIEEIILGVPPKCFIYNDDTGKLLFWNGVNLFNINMEII